MIDDVQDTPLYSIVKMQETLDDVNDSRNQKQRKCLDLMKMTPTKLVFVKKLEFGAEGFKCKMYCWFVFNSVICNC